MIQSIATVIAHSREQPLEKHAQLSGQVLAHDPVNRPVIAHSREQLASNGAQGRVSYVAHNLNVGQSQKRRRLGPQDKRARFGSVIPDVVDTQQAGHHGSLGPSTRRGPERYPVRGTTEALRRSAATRSKWAFA